MFKLKLLILALLVAACGRKPAPTPNPTPLIWSAERDCDGLLWVGLDMAAGNYNDILAARGPNGEWYRRPVAMGDCYPNESQSTISRDMLVGLLAGAVATNDLGIVEGVLEYAINHAGVMGKPWPGDGRTQMTPNLLGLYSRAAVKMGAKKWEVMAALNPVILAGSGDDYAVHLQLIELWLYSTIEGELPPHLAAAAVALRAANPNDALAQAVGCLLLLEGSCQAADALLDDPNYVYPSYVRGPASAQRVHKEFARKVANEL